MDIPLLSHSSNTPPSTTVEASPRTIRSLREILFSQPSEIPCRELFAVCCLLISETIDLRAISRTTFA